MPQRAPQAWPAQQVREVSTLLPRPEAQQPRAQRAVRRALQAQQGPPALQVQQDQEAWLRARLPEEKAEPAAWVARPRQVRLAAQVAPLFWLAREPGASTRRPGESGRSNRGPAGAPQALWESLAQTACLPLIGQAAAFSLNRWPLNRGAAGRAQAQQSEKLKLYLLTYGGKLRQRLAAPTGQKKSRRLSAIGIAATQVSPDTYTHSRAPFL